MADEYHHHFYSLCSRGVGSELLEVAADGRIGGKAGLELFQRERSALVEGKCEQAVGGWPVMVKWWWSTLSVSKRRKICLMTSLVSALVSSESVPPSATFAMRMNMASTSATESSPFPSSSNILNDATPTRDTISTRDYTTTPAQ